MQYEGHEAPEQVLHLDQEPPWFRRIRPERTVALARLEPSQAGNAVGDEDAGPVRGAGAWREQPRPGKRKDAYRDSVAHQPTGRRIPQAQAERADMRRRLEHRVRQRTHPAAFAISKLRVCTSGPSSRFTSESSRTMRTT